MANQRTMEVTGYSIQNPLSSVVQGSEEKTCYTANYSVLPLLYRQTYIQYIHTYTQYDVVGFRDDLVPRI